MDLAGAKTKKQNRPYSCYLWRVMFIPVGSFSLLNLIIVNGRCFIATESYRGHWKFTRSLIDGAAHISYKKKGTMIRFSSDKLWSGLAGQGQTMAALMARHQGDKNACQPITWNCDVWGMRRGRHEGNGNWILALCRACCRNFVTDVNSTNAGFGRV